MAAGAEKEINVRGIYGRGFFDGLKKAGIENPEDYMNPARLNELENSITSAARKVLDVVPINEAWTGKQVHAEMVRTGKTVDRAHVDGCLASLKSFGLVREPTAGTWMRVVAKPKLEQVSPPVVKVNPSIMKAAALVEKGEPLDQLAELAVSLRAMAKALDEVASKVESVAVEVDERIKRIDADGGKLRQLQELLRSIGQ